MPNYSNSTFKLSPFFVKLAAILPAGSSKTCRAPGINGVTLQGRRFSTVRSTVKFASRKITSMANLIKQVCTQLHGVNRTPSPSGSELRPSKPAARRQKLSARRILRPKHVPLEIFTTR